MSFELQFAQQTAPIKQIVIFEKVEPARDSVAVQTLPYAAAYSRLKRLDTLVVRYVVPAGANKALVRVDARVDSNNGQTKLRTFYLPPGRGHPHHRGQLRPHQRDRARRRPRPRPATWCATT